MRDSLIAFLECLNNDLDGTLLSVDIPNYVDKIQRHATILTISENDELKAFIAFYANDNNKEVAFLTMLAVCKESWRLGYGKRLLELSVNQIQEKGYNLYRLEVKADNSKAIKLYEAYGFVAAEVENGILTMEKHL